MLNSVTNYVYEQRKRLARTAGVAGSLYFVGRYALARIADMGDRVREERLAREKYGEFNSEYHVFSLLTSRSMRKRFRQNIQDTSFTIMTYLPLLNKHILDEMDVEALTAELQSLSRVAKLQHNIPLTQEPTIHPQPQQSSNVGSSWSPGSSVELVRPSDARSEASSASFLSASPSPHPEVSQLAESAASWVKAPQSSEAPSLERLGTSSTPLAPPSE